MALYEMYCENCKDEFTIKQSVHDELPKVCEKCGGKLKQKLGQVHLRTCTGYGIIDRCTSLAQNDIDNLKKGDQKVWADLAGTKPNPLKEQ